MARALVVFYVGAAKRGALVNQIRIPVVELLISAELAQGAAVPGLQVSKAAWRPPDGTVRVF